MSDQRVFLQLRAYISELLAAGAVIKAREPLRLAYDGRLYLVACGMMVCEE